MKTGVPRRGQVKSTKNAPSLRALQRKIARLEKQHRRDQALWEAKCTQGHLVRHDRCDLMCAVTLVDSWTSSRAPGTVVQWNVGKLPNPFWAAVKRFFHAENE